LRADALDKLKLTIPYFNKYLFDQKRSFGIDLTYGMSVSNPYPLKKPSDGEAMVV